MEKKKSRSVMMSVIALIWFSILCWPFGPPEAVSAANSTARAKSPVTETQGPSWEVEWNKALEAAKKEGKVVIGTAIASDARTALGKAFKDKYGIDVQWMAGRATELNTKIFAERREGIYSVDLFITGGITPFVSLQPAGLLEPLKPLLILPEVTNPKAWWGGGLWFSDKGKNLVSSPILTTSQYEIANSNMVKKGEITSYRDFLKPKWKGKIVMNDPTISGAGSRWFSVVTEKIMGVDFMRELAKQDIVVIRDQRLQMEWVSRGNYPIILGPQPTVTAEFVTAGAPLMPIEVSEGGWLGGGPGLVMYVNKAPNPNAAKIFINWFHTKEGQSIYGRISRTESARLDVSNDYLEPAERRKPNVKYFISEEEDFIMKLDNLMKLAGQIFSVKK